MGDVTNQVNTATLPAVTGPVVDNGAGVTLLQPENQVGAITAVATTGATNTTPYGYSQAQANAIVTAINAIIAALVTAGIVA